MKFLFYDIWTADIHGIEEHPQDYMNNHFKVIHCVPQSMFNGWWFCVEDFDFELPPFLSEMAYPYSLKYWRDQCWSNCEYFEKSFDCATQTRDDRYSCFGGWECLEEKYGEIENFEKINNIKEMEK